MTEAAGQAVAGLFSMGAGLLDARWNRKNSERNVDKTIRANKREAELAYQRQLEMWHLQNAYNTPEAQMQRFQNAGLNPHLIYGQGSPGNAMAPPSYQPPDIQYKYAAPEYGAAIQSALPTMMAVGTWLQNMRMGEVDIEQKKTLTEKAEQAIDYARLINPLNVRRAENTNSLFPYQEAAMDQSFRMNLQKMRDSDELFRYNFGDEIMDRYAVASPFDLKGTRGSLAGSKGQEFQKRAQELLIKQQELKLKEAQASWADLDITNPQALMQMVLSGALGMMGAGIGLKYRKGGPSVNRRTRDREKDFNETMKRFNDFAKRRY